MKTCALYNYGNTCYLNTILQCIANCDSLYKVLSQKESINNHVCYALYRTIRDMLRTKGILKPKGFIHNVVIPIMSDEWNEEHDIHEIYTLILGTMMQPENLNPIIYDGTEYLKSIVSRLHRGRADFTNIGRSVLKRRHMEFGSCDDEILHTLYGQIVYQIICSYCGVKHRNIDHISTLTIDASSESISKGLSMIFQTDKLDTDWRCDKCSTVASNSMCSKGIYRLPSILVITINRFMFDSKARKQTDKVRIPNEIDVSPICLMSGAIERTQPIYQLRSIGCHFGTPESGHCVASVKDDNGNFIIIDDETTHKVREADIQQNAYIVFYERKN